MRCPSCHQENIGHPSRCHHCDSPLIGERITTAVVARPSEQAEAVWRNVNDQMIVDPSFLGQSEIPTYRRLRWIRDDKITGPGPEQSPVVSATSGEILLRQVPQRERWRITRIVYGGPTAATLFKLHAGPSSYGQGLVPADIWDVNQTLNGLAVSTDCDRGLIPAGAMLRALFSGATVGDAVTVTCYVDVYILETGVGRPGGGSSEAMD